MEPLAVLIEERKNRAIETLSVQFSQNKLPMEEYERLVEYIHRAESERELTIIEKLVEETARYTGGSYASAGQGNTKFHFTILSSRNTPGDILRQNDCSFVNILGSNVVDIQEGDLPPGRTEMDVVAILGETKIFVPPGVAVTMQAVPIMGEAKIGRDVETQRSPGMPELVISGCSLLGSISVKLRKERRRR
jgi:hypothetical protein